MNYIQAREYLKKVSARGSVLGLESVKRLLEYIGNPQEKLNVVHVAGTNGKGSTLAFLQNILMDAKYSVGRFSSPAVFHYREMIRINDKYIEKEELAELVTMLKEQCDVMTAKGFPHPTLFEIETAMALKYFQKKNCQIVLIECGMGGATDATNVFEQVVCSVITSISLDHMEFLGNKIEEIARQKAGIIKENCPIVMAEQSRKVERIIQEIGQEKGANVIVAHRITKYSIEEGGTKIQYPASNGVVYQTRINMPGAYQLINSAVAIEVALVLQQKGYQVENYIATGIQKTFWEGRMEIVRKDPLLVIDGAHNPGAVKELKTSLDLYFTNRRITFIMGVLADKDFTREAEIIARRAEMIITVTPDNKRALDGAHLAEVLRQYHDFVICADSVKQALQMAEQSVREKRSDMILAFGSLSYLREIKYESAQDTKRK